MKERGVILARQRRAEMHLLSTIGTRRRTNSRLVGRLGCPDRTPFALPAGAQLVSRSPTPEGLRSVIKEVCAGPKYLASHFRSSGLPSIGNRQWSIASGDRVRARQSWPTQ